MESNDIDESIYAVRELYEKYREEPYMIQRLSQYIKVQLPTIMDSFHNNHIQRNIRNQELITNQEIFIENFFNRFKNYYYCVNTEKFFYYDQKNYLLIIEDDIIHHILRTITESGTISAWKQRTKVTIMKRIKENNILIQTDKLLDQMFDIMEAEYQGKKVQLNKPIRGGTKKFYVYVRDPKTKNIKKVSFGDTTGLSIKRDDPKRRKSFRARHNCDNPGPKTKARYWSCRMWTRTPVSKITKRKK